MKVSTIALYQISWRAIHIFDAKGQKTGDCRSIHTFEDSKIDRRTSDGSNIIGPVVADILLDLPRSREGNIEIKMMKSRSPRPEFEGKRFGVLQRIFTYLARVKYQLVSVFEPHCTSTKSVM